MFPRLASVLFVFLGTGCSAPRSPARDWQAHPAFVTHLERTPRVWAVSDVHGGIERFKTLLSGAGLTDAQGHWVGGADHLYVLGDCIDKAPGGLAALNWVRQLESEARGAGGELVMTLGNHEAEFLADPDSPKTAEFAMELSAAGLKPKAVAAGEGIGGWLRDLPLGVLDGEWFFSHAGNTAGQSLADLAQKLKVEFETDGFAAKTVAGPSSVLEAERWWEASADSTRLIDVHLTALGARHLVFGHDPGASVRRGSIGQLFSGRMFTIDVGMSPAVDDSPGALLLVERSGATTRVSAVFSAGTRAEIFTE